MVGMCGAAALAQPSTTEFKPGEWKVNMTMTINNGKTINSVTQICAKGPGDAWKQNRPNQTCDPIQITPVAGGVRVQMHCKSGSGPVVSETHGDFLTKFSNNGNTYSSSGTMTSATTMQGHPPMMMNMKMQAEGTRLGPCTSNSKP